MPTPPKTASPVILLFAGATLWGLSIPFMKALGCEQTVLFPAAGTLAAAAASLTLRFALAATAMALVFRVRLNAVTAYEWKHGLVLGVVTAISMLLQVDGLNYTSASTAGFLIAMYCVLVSVFAVAARMRPLSGVLVLCCLLVTAGLAALTGLNPASLSLGRGEWENLGAASLFAFQILWLGRLPAGFYDPARLTVALCAAVAACSLACLLALPHGPAALLGTHASQRALLLTACLGLLGTAAPFLIMNRYQALVGPVTAAFIYCMEPLASAAGAMFLPELLVRDPSLYPNEALSGRIWAGGGLILAANLLLLLERKVPASPEAA